MISGDLYRVYVDETGDRGWGDRASPIFVMTAVIVRDGGEQALLRALDEMNATLKKPPGTVLHWAENVKTHPQRKYVAGVLASLDMTVTNVVVLKKPMIGTNSGLSNATPMYNYCVRRLLERVSWFVRDAGGETTVAFAHVRRFPYEKLHGYLELLKLIPTSVHWPSFVGKPKIDQPRRVRQLQVADLVAGACGSALREDDFGNYEASYLMQIVPRIYVRGSAKVTSYGFNPIGPVEHLQSYPWWNDFEVACARRR
jgi:hypothetical protein